MPLSRRTDAGREADRIEVLQHTRRREGSLSIDPQGPEPGHVVDQAPPIPSQDVEWVVGDHLESRRLVGPRPGSRTNDRYQPRATLPLPPGTGPCAAPRHASHETSRGDDGDTRVTGRPGDRPTAERVLR